MVIGTMVFTHRNLLKFDWLCIKNKNYAFSENVYLDICGYVFAGFKKCSITLPPVTDANPYSHRRIRFF